MKTVEGYPDPQTVKQGFPTVLLLLDSLVSSSPDDTDLLLAVTNAYNAYCQAFLTDEMHWERAAKLFKIGKRHGFRLFENKKYVDDLDTVSIDDLEYALKKLKKKDVPYLYATASVWMGWILTNMDSMEAVGDLSKALALMNRVLELDNEFNNGSVHLFYGVFYAVQPRGGGQDLSKSKTHFNRAIELGGENNIMPLVAFAEYYGRATLDEQLFTDTINKAINTDLNKRPEIRLMNEVALNRAKYLLENMNDLF